MAEDITAHIGFIGGSGLEELISKEDGFEDVKSYYNIFTPEGRISKLDVGTKDGKKVYFISRHGRDREYSPNNVPYNAYMWLFANAKRIEPFLNEKEGIPELFNASYLKKFPHLKDEKGIDLRTEVQLEFKTKKEIEKYKVDHVFAFSATGSYDDKVPLGAFIINDSIGMGVGDSPITPFDLKDSQHPIPELGIEKKGIDFLSEVGTELNYEIHNGIYLMNTAGEAFESAWQVANQQYPARAHEAFMKFFEKTKDSKKWRVRTAYKGADWLFDGELTKLYDGLNYPGSEHLKIAGMQVGMTSFNEAALASQLGMKYNLISAPVNWGVGMNPEDFKFSKHLLTPHFEQQLGVQSVDLSVVSHDLTEKVMEEYKPLIKTYASGIIKNYQPN